MPRFTITLSAAHVFFCIAVAGTQQVSPRIDRIAQFNSDGRLEFPEKNSLQWADAEATHHKQKYHVERRKVMRSQSLLETNGEKKSGADATGSLVATKETSSFQLHTTVGTSNLKIPKQVLLTGPFDAFSVLFRRRRNADLFNWLGLSKDMYVRYFNDTACRAYIHQHYGQELTAIFDAETYGSYRGDLCRTAILLKDGGFYIDLDMQLRVPLMSLVDDATTFMTARSSFNGALNAIIAATPGSPVLKETLTHMYKWYRNETKQEAPMGPVTMQRGLEEVINKTCPRHDWKTEGVFPCGRERGIRLYTEVRLEKCSTWGTVICPNGRRARTWDGLKYGLFAGSKDDILKASMHDRETNFIGWTRAADCQILGCRVSGGNRYK